MSNSIQPPATPLDEFQAHFGAAPGTLDAKAECEKWQRLCAELLAERDKLRAALADEQAAHERTVLTMMRDEVDPNLTMEEIYASIDRGTSFEQLIAELRAEAEAGK